MRFKKYITKSPSQTKGLGKNLAKEILKSPPQKEALILGLKGDLGGGKTTFLQGFAMGLGIKEKILSPTFVIIKKFSITEPRNSGAKVKIKTKSSSPSKSKFSNFYHIDCYRIERLKGVLDLGFREIISDSQNIVTIEWADRIDKILPAKAIIINFEFVDQKTRKITIGFKND